MGNTAAVGSPAVGSPGGSQAIPEDASPDEQLAKLASQFKVSKAELELLRKRFDVLGPDEDGLIDRSVFQTEPYDSDPFCKQIWLRLPGQRDAPDKISFQSFVRTMMWWEQAPVKNKLQLLFTWMQDAGGITAEQLAKILRHALPDYQEEELKKMSGQIISVMVLSAGSSSLNMEDFLMWFDTVPEDKLKEALDFKVLRLT